MIRKLLLCWTGFCPGIIDYDSQGVRWKCSRCDKIVRYAPWMGEDE